jgi:RHS repeat-associated protein
MNAALRTALTSLGLAALLLTQVNGFQSAPPGTDLTNPIAPKSRINPTPKRCCDCIKISVTGINPKLKPGLHVAAKREANGDQKLYIGVEIGAHSGVDCKYDKKEVVIEWIKLLSEKAGGEVEVPTSGGEVVIPAAKLKEFGLEWKVKVKCVGQAMYDPGVPGIEQDGCNTSFKIPSDGCTSCMDGTCSLGVINGSFTCNIPLGSGDAGDTSGTLRFFALNFENPGVAGLDAIVPSSYTVTRNAAGQIQSISTGVNIIEVTASPTAFDPNAFTVTHRNVADPAPFRVTVISLVDDGGAVRLRADSTYAGATYRHEQTQPQPGTLVLESGRVEGGNFIALRRETHIVDKPEPGKEIQRDIIAERATTTDPFQSISDVRVTWQEFMWGWEKIEEVVDPDGAALTSTWSYYGPGETTGPNAATNGFGRLKYHSRHDGHEELHTYWLNHHQTQLPFAGDPQGLTMVEEYVPQSHTTTITRSVGGNVLSKSSESFDSANNRETNTVYTAAGEALVTTAYHVPYASDFGGKPSRTIAPDGTLTTYSYSRNAATGGKTIVMEQGASTNGTSVAKGTRTTTSYNRFGTAIRQISQAIGYGTGDAIFEHMAVTAIDNVGRPLTTAYFPSASTVTGDVAAATAPKWMSSQEFACCGVVTETDRTGVVTRHAYDSLRRRVKTNSLGVTSETAYRGRTTESHRYPETVGGTLSATLAGTNANLVGRSVTNLAGTYQESWSPNPASATPGALVKATTTTTYQPGAGLSSRTVAKTPDDFTQTSDSFLDRKSATTYGDLSPGMVHSYTVTATGLTASRSYLDGVNLRETVTTTSDWAGRQVRTEFADSAFATVSYNAIGQMVSSTDPDGVTALMAYDSLGQRSISAVDLNANGSIDYGTDTVTFSESVPALNGADPVMRSVQKIWQDGDTNPAAGTLVATSDSAPDGLSSSSTSIGVANPATSLTTLGTGGNMTQKQVSPDGSYTISTVVAGRADVTTFYDNTDTLIASSATRDATDISGSGYDSLGRPTHSNDSRTGVSSTAYLSTTADVAMSVTDPGARTTAFAYDIRGRRISVDAPDTLDAAGDPLTNITTTSYFPDGNIQEVSGGQTYRVSHTYDYADRQKTLTTYGGTTATTTWIYSSTRGFLVEKNYHGETDDGTIDPDYTYTAAGRLLTRTWERGVVTTYGYDSGGRLITTSYSDGTPAVSLAYDSLGRKVSETQVNLSSFSFTYNPTTLAPATETLAYDLDEDGTPDFTRVLHRSQDTLGRESGWRLGTESQHQAGWVDSNGDPDRENQTAYTYSETTGRFGTVTSPAGAFTYAYEANSMGLLYTVTGPVHVVTNNWDPTRDVLTAKENEVGVNPISAYVYTVNPLGQRTEVGKTGSAFASNRSIAWGYDSFGQVIKADSTEGFDRAYKYDGIGNRKETVDGLTLSNTDNYVANALNQYTTVGAISPTYDLDGNATAYPVPMDLSANSVLGWDAENRLISATAGTTTTTYYYDSGSRRIFQKTGSTTTVYVYDGWNPVAEYSGTTLAKTYTWGLDLSGSLQGAGGVGGLLAVIDEVASGTPSYFPTFDGNGNVSEYLDDTGAVKAHYEYDPFGRTTVASEPKAADFAHRFSTKPIDSATGLLYYGYRFYDPMTGRWPSRDPIGESGGDNVYGLVKNNPLSFCDILGLEEWKKRPPLFKCSAKGGSKSFRVYELGGVETPDLKSHPRTDIEGSKVVSMDATSIGDMIDRMRRNIEGSECIKSITFFVHGAGGGFYIGGEFANTADDGIALAKILKPAMCEGPTIRFVSCCTGAKEDSGMVVAVAQNLGATVQAPIGFGYLSGKFGDGLDEGVGSQKAYKTQQWMISSPKGWISVDPKGGVTALPGKTVLRVPGVIWSDERKVYEK